MNSQQNNFNTAPQKFTGKLQMDNDLTEEEQQIMMDVQLMQEEMQRELYLKQEGESKLKQERKMTAKQQLDEWQASWQKNIHNKKAENKREAEEQLETMKESKKGNNPWVRVCENSEMDSQKYIGDKEVSRMRESMIARKADITKKGGM